MSENYGKVFGEDDSAAQGLAAMRECVHEAITLSQAHTFVGEDSSTDRTRSVSIAWNCV